MHSEPDGQLSVAGGRPSGAEDRREAGEKGAEDRREAGEKGVAPALRL
jgi:hypothetical protein